MKKAVLIIAFIFIFLSISLVSAVLVYNSAKSNVSNKIHEDVLNDVNLFNIAIPDEQAEKKGLNAVNVKLAKEIHINVSSSVSLLKGSWDEEENVPCNLRGELNITKCEEEVPFVGVEPSPHRPGRR